MLPDSSGNSACRSDAFRLSGLTCKRGGRSIIPLLVYLFSFVVLLIFVSRFYLFPAIEAAHATMKARPTSAPTSASRLAVEKADKLRLDTLSAQATLVLAIVLFVLLAGLLLTFRIGRFFRVSPDSRPKPTRYVDAWEESGRRLKLPEDET